MSRIRNPFSLNAVVGVYVVVLVGANFLTALSMTLLYPLIRNEADIEFFKRAYEGLALLNLAYFLVPSILCGFYVRPLSELRPELPLSPLAKSRLLNGPLVMSLLSITGWLTVVVGFFIGAFINGVSLRWGAVGRYILESLLAGSLAFAITYYLLEFISRRYFIPRFFPEGDLSTVEGAVNLSVRARFYIHFFAVAIFPVFLFYSVIATLANRSDPGDALLPVTALTVVVLALGAFVTYLISSAYQTPLVEMKQATTQIRAGEYETRVEVVSNDEIGLLGEALNEMAAGLKERELLKLEHERIRQELALAWRIQASFLPRAVPEVPGWQLTATLEPARQTSGDFYDLIPLADGRLGLLVADVTDKGMGAALYMALSRTVIRTYAGEQDSQPEQVLGAAHRRILADTDTNQFVTVFYGILDPVTGSLTYSNAGHNPPYLLCGHPDDDNGNGADEPVEVHELENTGPPLGLSMFKDFDWEQRTIQLGAGDVLVLYSDGVTEAQDLQEELFEEERLVELARANMGRPAQAIQEALISGVHAFVGEAPQSDDITLMVLVRGALN
jgi:serine phosphatase RsbU (regulator of sigma subunit)